MAVRHRKSEKHSKSDVTQFYIIIGMCILISGSLGLAIGQSTCESVAIESETAMLNTTSLNLLSSDEEAGYYDVPLSHALQNYIYEICVDEEVPVSLVIAMIDHESKFNPEAVSDTGDYGLMQINKINHDTLKEQYRTVDMLDPYQNVYCGIKMIGLYLKLYEDYTKALMAYNMGEYGAKKAWRNGINSTKYTNAVLELMSEYERGLYNEQ